MNKKALICGISGQDGSYLAKFLLGKGYTVYGTSRDVQGTSFINLKALDIFNKIKLISMDVEDFHSVYIAVKQCEPDEIYFLAGQSSVSLSFEQPVETIKSIEFGALNILEACRLFGKKIRLYHAGSSECFGETQNYPANEKTAFKPRSPYAVAKSSAYWLVANYREAYNLFACTGILFNHDSPLRPDRFVTKKIVNSAKRIAKGSSEILTLGRLDIYRDWGWAPEYVEVMWLMLQQDQPEDFVVATGKSYKLEDFVSLAFDNVGLDWRKHVIQSDVFFRPTDIIFSNADPEKSKRKLGWQPKFFMSQVVNSMMQEA